MTLDERIEAAARKLFSESIDDQDASGFDEETERLKLEWVASARAIVSAAFPELFTSPPTMWLAPMEATREMVLAAERAWDQCPDERLSPIAALHAAKNAYLNREGK